MAFGGDGLYLNIILPNTIPKPKVNVTCAYLEPDCTSCPRGKHCFSRRILLGWRNCDVRKILPFSPPTTYPSQVQIIPPLWPPYSSCVWSPVRWRRSGGGGGGNGSVRQFGMMKQITNHLLLSHIIISPV